MIHHLQRGLVPDKPHTVFEVDGRLVYEHCFTRAGFESIYTNLYHRSPPHWVAGEKDFGFHSGGGQQTALDTLRRVHLQTGRAPKGGSPFLDRQLLLANPDLGVWIAHPEQSEPSLVANADGDELTFVHAGRGRVETPLGVVSFEPGDYVYVPCSLPHRWLLDEPAHLLIIEARNQLRVPKQYRSPEGQLSMYAPFCHGDFKVPVWPEGGPESLEAPRVLRVLAAGRVTETELANDPFDVVGWEGQLWPFAFPIRRFQPKTGQVHLPPTIHTTFAGNGFVVCSFVPRLVDFHEKAVPCPYAHSSPDCDEILFYVDGNFTSRKGIASGSITFHPRGIPHGPHPGTYEASVGTERTDELAVMIDTYKPLMMTENAAQIEEEGYNRSWVK